MKLKAGYGERTITPPLGVDLCGYGFYLDRKGESVLDQLKARVLFLEKDAGRILLICCDLIALSIDFSDGIRKALAKEFDLPFEHILLSCTHTHSGPATSSLASLGAVDPQYMRSIGPEIREAASTARLDLRDAVFSHCTEIIEPIGFNRRTGDFSSIDPALNVGLFKQEFRNIYMLNYGCHAVTLGKTRQISADWPGAVAAEIEGRGHRAIVFQGFCGNIDPVTQMNRWGQGTDEDLLYYGKLVAARAAKAGRHAVEAKEKGLEGVERRISLPLAVPEKDGIDPERDDFLNGFGKAFPNAERFIDEWMEGAKQRYDAISAHPIVENIPLQAISIGDLKIMALPGEVDCQYGVRLREKWAPLFTIGYSGGVIGYMPVSEAYRRAGDYACYQAPKFYGNFFPFKEEIEDILLKACEELLGM